MREDVYFYSFHGQVYGVVAQQTFPLILPSSLASVLRPLQWEIPWPCCYIWWSSSFVVISLCYFSSLFLHSQFHYLAITGSHLNLFHICDFWSHHLYVCSWKLMESFSCAALNINRVVLQISLFLILSTQSCVFKICFCVVWWAMYSVQWWVTYLLLCWCMPSFPLILLSRSVNVCMGFTRVFPEELVGHRLFLYLISANTAWSLFLWV